MTQNVITRIELLPLPSATFMADEGPSHGRGGSFPWPRGGPSLDHALGPAQTLTWASRFYTPHNSPLKSCYPAPRTERRVLVSSSLCHGLPSLVLHQCRSLFVCQGHVPDCETFFEFTEVAPPNTTSGESSKSIWKNCSNSRVFSGFAKNKILSVVKVDEGQRSIQLGYCGVAQPDTTSPESSKSIWKYCSNLRVFSGFAQTQNTECRPSR